MTDIVERLRGGGDHRLMLEAADEIERLRAELKVWDDKFWSDAEKDAKRERQQNWLGNPDFPCSD